MRCACLLLSALPVGLAAGPAPVSAQAIAPTRQYEIAAQPLATALAEFAAMSGINLLYRPGLAEGRRSSAIKGNYSAPLALQKLLQGTGLQARFTSADAAILYAPEAGSDAPSHARSGPQAPALRLGMAEVRAPQLIGGRDAGAASRYAMLVRQKINALLYANPALRGRQFTMELDVYVDAAGLIRETLVRHSRDTANWADQITATLAGQALPPPPTGIRQPMRFAITASQFSPESTRP